LKAHGGIILQLEANKMVYFFYGRERQRPSNFFTAIFGRWLDCAHFLTFTGHVWQKTTDGMGLRYSPEKRLYIPVQLLPRNPEVKTNM
jgi:hypothetical protein